MKKHLVLGDGRLSQEIQNMLRKHDIDYAVARRIDFSYPEETNLITFEDYEVVWNCTGHGSVGGDTQKQIMAHIGLVDFLVKKDVKQIHFSSNYAERPEKSFYARTKWMTEEIVFNSKNKKASIVRVANLCGDGYGIIHKIINNMITEKYPRIVSNYVSPTDTRSLAEFLVTEHESLFANPRFWCIYSKPVRVDDLALKIKEMIVEIKGQEFDPKFTYTSDFERPIDYKEPDVRISTPVLTQELVAKVLTETPFQI